MSGTTIGIAAGLVLVFAFALWGGYHAGADAAARDNRADQQIQPHDQN